MDMYKGAIPILDDKTDNDFVFPSDDGFGRGYVPRDYEECPEEMMDAPSEIKAIPVSEWDARYEEQEKLQSSLEHLYLSGPNGTPRFVNLDQGPNGYCWMFSKGSAMMLDRLKANMPLKRLNPCAAAAIFMKGADRGGWCGLGVDLLETMGMPDEDHWPGNSRDLRNNTIEMRQNAAKHRIVEKWFDLTRPVHGQKMTELQIATQGFNGVPVPQDFMWWGHSVCGIRWVRIEKGSWGPLILNSWSGWGRHGLAVLRGSKAKCDGAIAIRSTTASAA